MNIDERNKIIDDYFREQGNNLYVFALSQLKNSDLAKEAVQETFLRATTYFDKFYAAVNHIGWLVATLKSVVIVQYKDRQKTAALIESLQNNGKKSHEDEHNIYTSLKGVIDDETLKMLIMVYCDGYSYAEAAKAFNTSLSACKSRIRRAKERLIKHLKST